MSLKEKMKKQESIAGMHISLADSSATEICASTGYDFLWIDTEHAPIDRQILLHHLVAAHSGGTQTLVRVGWNDPVMIKQVLELGPDGVIVPKNRSAGLDAVAAKTSAGAVHYTPVVRVTNLSQTVDVLKERGLWLAGADMSGEKSLFESDLTGPIALVVGSEGKGISRLLREKCDFMVKIPMLGEIESLNASVAAAIMMYEIVRQRQQR